MRLHLRDASLPPAFLIGAAAANLIVALMFAG